MSSSPITITTPLPTEALVFESMRFEAGICSLGAMTVSLTSERSDIDANELLGQPVSVQVKQRDESIRYFNGIVSRFAVSRHLGRHFTYQATVRPWLWFLTRTSDCRVFQDMTVPDIVKAVFADHGIADFKFNLFRSYRPWVYCVQYRESDYNFVARLLEHEGIYWFFDHSAGAKHQLRLVDSPTAHDPIPGNSVIPYFADSGDIAPDLDYATAWTWTNAVRSGATAMRSYDFERPSTLLESMAKHPRKHALSSEEVYDFQGEWVKQADGDQLNGNRIDELQSGHGTAQGSSNAHGLTVGHLFSLDKHPHEAQNAKYLITSTAVRANVAPQESGGDPVTYEVDFGVVPADPQYRPPRVTPKPFVQGPQTAVVVGPAGDEIYTDKYGRVKLQFHWDRYGKKNETSSCWVRVSHPWAGKNFGMVHTPRIGQEVVVDFLEGDPDQPLITGRVYNAEQMPPWELPANATQSGILTRSSKDGAYNNANALRFEDKKGEEQLWLHAEKDQLTEVENDEKKWVGRDRVKTVDRDETNHIQRDRFETVDGHEKITVHKTRTEEVDGDESITIHSSRKERVDHEEKVSIGDSRNEDVGKDENITIGSNQSLKVGSNRTKSIGKNEKVDIGKNWSIKVAQMKTETIGMASMQNVALGRMDSVGLGYNLNVGAMMIANVGGSLSETIGTTHTQKTGTSHVHEVGTTLSIKAGESIELVCGDSVLKMTKDGKITVNGKNIDLVASEHMGLESKRIDVN